MANRNLAKHFQGRNFAMYVALYLITTSYAKKGQFTKITK